MSKRTSVRGAALGAVPTLFLLACACLAQAQAVAPDAARRRALTELVRQDCGSCHGMTLKGGLGPPLTREAVADKSADMLAWTILLGRPGTPMPPWRDFVDAREAAWIVERLQGGTLDAH